jgi:hypothetical protein
MRTYLILPGAGLLAATIALATQSLFAQAQAQIQPMGKVLASIDPINVGWEFQGQTQLNQVKIAETQYTGECSGLETQVIPARFISSKTQPGDKRRVIVRNLTRGLASDPSPFTNREYKGRTSEATQMEFGNSHSSKRFRVMPGINEFEYEIRDRKTVIDSGRFTATIEKDLRKIERNAQWYEESVCANSSVSNNVCADIRDRRQYRCPDGKVLKSKMTPSIEDESIRTLISNQTYKDITIEIDKDIYRIEPGESLRLRRRESLRVRYNPDCANCEPTRTETIPVGKRMKFQPKSQSEKQIELVDYPKD